MKEIKVKYNYLIHTGFNYPIWEISDKLNTMEVKNNEIHNTEEN